MHKCDLTRAGLGFIKTSTPSPISSRLARAKLSQIWIPRPILPINRAFQPPTSLFDRAVIQTQSNIKELCSTSGQLNSPSFDPLTLGTFNQLPLRFKHHKHFPCKNLPGGVIRYHADTHASTLHGIDS